MTICQKCQSQLTNADLRRQRCPRCDSPIEDGDGTIHDATNVTIDLATDHGQSRQADWNATTDSATASAGDSRLEPTLDSAVMSSGSSAPPLDNAGRTLDYSSDAESIERQLNVLWGPSEQSEKPLATLRGATRPDSAANEGGSDRMTLVIRERAVRPNSPGDTLSTADYDVLKLLGEGGMGVVYSARQASIDREVAIKMLRPQLGSNDALRRKFLSEATVTGELDHPNIVPIYDLGQNADGALFYSMKKVQGTPWSSVIRSKSLFDNLTVLLKVADAVAFAHARGIVHRDLKPENVMLGDFGEVLVLDWGLAVATEGHRDTPNVEVAQGVAGTPAYMSPELAYGPMDAIGKHSDIYLLGAILYEIVTGTAPHKGQSARLCLAAAVRNEIIPTDKRGELVDIARKAMATAPSDRHATVQLFQEAVREYLAHTESISLCDKAQEDLAKAIRTDDYRDYARSVFAFEEAYALWNGNDSAFAGASKSKLHYAGSALHKHDYDLGLSLLDANDPAHTEIRELLLASKRDRDLRQQRLKRARRVVAALLALVFAAVTIGIVLVTGLKWEADRQADIARSNANEALRQSKIARQNAEEAERQSGIAKQNAEEAQRQSTIAYDQKAEAERLSGIALENKLEADRRREEAEQEAYVALIGMAAAKINENAFEQAHLALESCRPGLRGWEWGRLQYVVRQGRRQQLPVNGRPECLAFNSQGSLLATGTRDGLVQIWDLKSQELRKEMRLDATNAIVTALAFAPGQHSQLAIGSNLKDRFLQLWDYEADEPSQSLHNLVGHEATVVSVAYSRDASRLITASHDHTARLWATETGQEQSILRGHSWFVWSAAFSPDENHVATASEDGTVRLWDANSGQEWKTATGQQTPFRGHRGPVFAVAFLPAGAAVKGSENGKNPPDSELQIVSAGYDKRVLIWKPSDLASFPFERLLKEQDVQRTPVRELIGHAAAVRHLSVSADGNRIVSASNDQTIRIWHARDLDIGYAIVKSGTLEKELRGHDGPVQVAAVSPTDADFVASAGYDGSVRLWRVAEYQEEQTIPGLALKGHHDAVLAARFSPDGASVVTASRDRTAKKWRVSDGKEELTFREGHAYLTSKALIDPRRKRLLTAAIDGTLRAWSIETAAELFVVNGIGYRAAVAIDSQSRWILTGSDQSNEPQTGGASQPLSRWGAVVWDAETGERLRQFNPNHKAAISCVAFSPDGRWAYSGDDHGTGHLWDMSTGEHLARLDFHISTITAAVFAANGSSLITSSGDKLVCFWDLQDPRNVRPVPEHTLRHSSPVNSIALDAAGDALVSGCEDGQLQVWNLRTRDARPLLRVDPGEASPLKNVNSVSLSDDGKWLLVVDSQFDRVSLLEMATGEERLVLKLKERDAIGWSAAFLPESAGTPVGDCPPFVTVGGDEARLWNSQGTELASFGPHRPIAFVELSRPDGLRLITAGWDHSARLWDAHTGAALITLNDHTAGELQGHKGPVHSAVFSPDGSRVLTASEDGTLRLWDPANRRVLRVHDLVHGPIMRAVLARDGERYLAACRDGVLIIGSLNDSAPRRVLQGHKQVVLDVAFSPDEKFIVSGSADSTARIWDAVTGAELLMLDGHTGDVTAVDFACDQRGKLRVLTGSTDRTAKLWDVSSLTQSDAIDEPVAKELLTLKGHSRGLTSVAFSPLDRSILTAGRDGVSIVWPADEWDFDERTIDRRSSSPQPRQAIGRAQ